MDKGPVIEFNNPRLVPSLGEGRGVGACRPILLLKKIRLKPALSVSKI